MRLGHVGRLWVIGGLVGAALLFAVGWFFLIGPQYSEAGRLRDQALEGEVRVGTLQRKLVELRRDNVDLPKYRAELESDHRALPSTPESSDLLRELQEASVQAGVVVDGLNIGTRTEVDGAEGAVYALPVGLTVAGSDVGLELFLNQIQQVQARAVLIRSAHTTVDETGKVSLTVNLNVFVASKAAATPAPGTPATPTS
jgi:Tfp pilus assembly protein PilO